MIHRDIFIRHFFNLFYRDCKSQISINGCWFISYAPAHTLSPVKVMLSILKNSPEKEILFELSRHCCQHDGGYVCLWLTALFSLPDGPCDAGGLDIGCAPHSWLAFVSAVRKAHLPTPPLHTHRCIINVS